MIQEICKVLSDFVQETGLTIVPLTVLTRMLNKAGHTLHPNTISMLREYNIVEFLDGVVVINVCDLAEFMSDDQWLANPADAE